MQITIRIPSVAGYASAKLAAWLDRSAYGEPKDARDLRLALWWYAESAATADRLYDTEEGNAILVAEDFDVPLASAHLLGADIAGVIGRARLSELLERCPGDDHMLTANLGDATHDTRELVRRGELISALTRGLSTIDGRLPRM